MDGPSPWTDTGSVVTVEKQRRAVSRTSVLLVALVIAALALAMRPAPAEEKFDSVPDCACVHG